MGAFNIPIQGSPKLFGLHWIFFLWRIDPRWAMASSLLKFLDHKQRRTTIDRTPLDEWSARRRDLYMTTHNTHYRRTFTSAVGSEPTIYEPQQTDASDGANAGTRLSWHGGSHLHETSVNICQFKRRRNTEERNFFQHFCENLRRSKYRQIARSSP